MPAENKPCPFCGCTLIEEVLIGMNGCDEHVMECTECGCHIHGENLMHARSKWNRRGDIKDEKFTTDNQQSKAGSEDSTQICPHFDRWTIFDSNGVAMYKIPACISQGKLLPC